MTNGEIIARELKRDGDLPVNSLAALQMLYALEIAVSEDCPDNQWWDIPYSHIDFLRNITELEGRFLDVGCGIGAKMYVAKNWAGFQDVSGVEIDPRLARIAKRFGAVYVLDAADFTDYDQYDVIYSYEPMLDSSKIYEKIERDMKVGGVFLRAHHDFGISKFVKE